MESTAPTSPSPAITTSPPSLEMYGQRTNKTLSILAGVFIILYAVEVLLPELNGLEKRVIDVANYLIWTCFVLDLIVRIYLSPSRLRYLLTHPVDVLAVALPALRSLRILRIFASGQLLLSRRNGLAQAGQSIVLAAGLLIFIGALAVLDAERNAPGALITSFPDALWWSITTLTTVGYGDLYPVTGMGRGVAAALMLVGISLLGVVTASIASWFLIQEPESPSTSPAKDELQEEITALRLQVERLTVLMRQEQVSPPTSPVNPQEYVKKSNSL